MTTESNLAEYYEQRAHEYDRIYDKPERQQDLATLRAKLPEMFAGLDVLEVACGTGYWTSATSRTACSILATDINEEVLQIGRSRCASARNVQFLKTDAYTLDGVSGTFNAALAGFWWSHIRLDRIVGFLDTLHAKLRPGALVVIVDNNFVEGSSTPISRTDAEGNTYQRRQLDDGSTHEILKNFPTTNNLRATLTKSSAEDVRFDILPYYWSVSYHTRVG